MQLNTLASRTSFKDRKRIGRGGKRGKTSGKGGKGQTARAGGRPRPEMRDTIKRLPKRRGYGRNRARTVNPENARPVVINVGRLETAFAQGAEVTPKALLKEKLVAGRVAEGAYVKILGAGEITKALKISGCEVSASAKTKIEAAGGTIL